MPILLLFNCIFVAAIVPISQLKLYFMEKDVTGKILGLHIHSNLIDELNSLSVIIGVDVDILFCDALKMYLSAMQICTHRIIECADSKGLVNIDEDGNKSIS